MKALLLLTLAFVCASSDASANKFKPKGRVFNCTVLKGIEATLGRSGLEKLAVKYNVTPLERRRALRCLNS